MTDTSNVSSHRAALIILDGWGYALPGPGNAVSLADTPVWDVLWERYPHALLAASGEAVGLPAGVMGNSKMAISPSVRGASSIRTFRESLGPSPTARSTPTLSSPVRLDDVATRGAALHLMGLFSDAGVHLSLGHLRALVRMARERGVGRLLIHAFTDGRDTSPVAAKATWWRWRRSCARRAWVRWPPSPGVVLAMDRDRRWDRVKLAYDALVHNVGLQAADGSTAIREAYGRGETDEFIMPTVVGDGAGSRIADGDGVFFFNFRPDRARELCAALTRPEFSDFDRGGAIPRIELAGMTEYDPSLGLPAAFPKEEPRSVLAEVVSAAGAVQLHIAETEKYAHVTFFFNGGREQPFPGEMRSLIPSQKDVATYDERPAMSAYEVASCFADAMREDPADLVVLNFANPDMVGHTGNLKATVEAVEHVDRCLGRVLEVLEPLGAKVMITADHGNAEYMLEADGTINTAHTTNPVPLMILDESVVLREGAGLSDLAPTLLCFLGLDVPAEMSGRSLCSGE